MLCAYSDSSSSEDERETKDLTMTTAKSEPVALPSADELFGSSSDATTAMTSGLVSNAAPRSDRALHLNKERKRKTGHQTLDEHPSKWTRIQDVQPQTTKPTPTTKSSNIPVMFKPPQLERPNVSTEDFSAWNTKKTMLHRIVKAHKNQTN